MNVAVPGVALLFSYTYPDNFGKFVTVDWVILFLLILSVLVLFDGLRRIYVTLRKWKEDGQIGQNETNMFFHILSFSIFVISRGTETYYE